MRVFPAYPGRYVHLARLGWGPVPQEDLGGAMGRWAERAGKPSGLGTDLYLYELIAA